MDLSVYKPRLVLYFKDEHGRPRALTTAIESKSLICEAIKTNKVIEIEGEFLNTFYFVRMKEITNERLSSFYSQPIEIRERIIAKFGEDVEKKLLVMSEMEFKSYFLNKVEWTTT